MTTNPPTGKPHPNEIAERLTKAQRRCVEQGNIGYNNDDTMDTSGRRMIYRLIDQGLFETKTGMKGPDFYLTPLGAEVRRAILREAASKARAKGVGEP